MRSLAWSTAFAALFVALYAIAVATPIGQQVDGRSLGLFYTEIGPGAVLLRWVRWGSVVVLAVLAAAVVIVGLLGRRWEDASFTLLGVATVTLASGWIRDDLLTRPAYAGLVHVVNSYPSRHVAVSVALCVAVVRLWPWERSRGRATEVAAIIVPIVALASVVTFAHRASDVIGGILLVGAATPLYARFRAVDVRAALHGRRSTKLAIVAVFMIGMALACAPIWPVYAVGLLAATVTTSLATGAVVLRACCVAVAPPPAIKPS